MSAEPETAPEPEAEAALELSAYEVERAGWFEELGFSDLQALVLATTRDRAGQLVTVHDVRRVINSGCDVDTAYQIFA